MSEESKSKKVLPGGLGCQGCGCFIILLLIIAAFAAGVVYHEEAETKLSEVMEEFSEEPLLPGEVQNKIDEIKDKVK